MSGSKQQTYDELLEQAEARRGDKRYRPVGFIPRRVGRTVTLERVCSCHGCTHAHCYAEFEGAA